MIDRFYKDSIQILRATSTQGTNGEVTKTWAVLSTLNGFLNAHSGGKQYNSGQQVVISTARLFLPAGTTITTLDRIKHVKSGFEYDILNIITPTDSVSQLENYLTIDLRHSGL